MVLLRSNQQRNARRRPRSGFSHRDLLVVLLILGVLGALAGPSVLWWRERSRRQQCVQNLKQLGIALRAYHQTYRSLPPAAEWGTNDMRSLALHTSKRVDLFTYSNWIQKLLPHLGRDDLAQQFHPQLPVADEDNAPARQTPLDTLTCPSDTYNRADNAHDFQPVDGVSVRFARGNYAINGGSHNHRVEPGSTVSPTGDGVHLAIDRAQRVFQMWGNGVAGFNKSFSLEEFTNGTSTLVALEEIRAGIHPTDPRGSWALGQVGASVTWAHGVNGDAYGPNNSGERSDDILGCARLHELLGTETLNREGMPCVWYVDQNQNATARSQHEGGVYVLFLDGAVRFIADHIDPGLWHVIHSRETPPRLLADDFEDRLQVSDFRQHAAPPPPTGPASPAADRPSTIRNSVGMVFVLVPAGQFPMGLADANNDHDLPQEAPVHTVRLTHPYYLGRYEVTQAEFAQLLDENPSLHRPAGTGAENPDDAQVQGRFPVEQVRWSEAVEFCQRLSDLPAEKSAGRSYRLPTEAEWEYACRAGSDVPYEWNPTRPKNDSTGEAAGIRPPLEIAPVGSYPANPFGLHDMRGNVWEWCADWFDRDYYQRSPQEDPQGPADGYLKVVRGGDWRYVGEGCKIDYPMLAPWKRNPFIGFRIVCDVRADR